MIIFQEVPLSTRRTKIAIWLTSGAVVTVLTCMGWWLYGASLEMDGKAPVSCGQAIRFLHTNQPPETARDKRCTKGQWQSTWYHMDFEVTRAEAEAWLHAAYPDAKVNRDCLEADLCSYPDVDVDGDGRADLMHVDIRFKENDLANVRVSGGTTN
ncbi:hypothetical protein [Streptomyces sp. NPDC002209]|uniref:hypothetical protein n=1 Tax=Streptomyces sp. NPDC002209 TaxID=3364638 RepID=UPI00369C671E